GHEIAKALYGRRSGSQQRNKSPPDVPGKEDLTRVLLGKREKVSSVESTKPVKERPWDIREQHYKAQKDALSTYLMLCMKDGARVQHFLAREDIGTPEYLETQRDLMESNENDCKQLR